MNDNSKTERSRRYLNPYVGGVLLGLVLLAANFISGRGLGASGAVKSVVATTIGIVLMNSPIIPVAISSGKNAQDVVIVVLQIGTIRSLHTRSPVCSGVNFLVL